MHAKSQSEPASARVRAELGGSFQNSRPDSEIRRSAPGSRHGQRDESAVPLVARAFSIASQIGAPKGVSSPLAREEYSREDEIRSPETRRGSAPRTPITESEALTPRGPCDADYPQAMQRSNFKRCRSSAACECPYRFGVNGKCLPVAIRRGPITREPAHHTWPARPDSIGRERTGKRRLAPALPNGWSRRGACSECEQPQIVVPQWAARRRGRRHLHGRPGTRYRCGEREAEATSRRLDPIASPIRGRLRRAHYSWRTVVLTSYSTTGLCASGRSARRRAGRQDAGKSSASCSRTHPRFRPTCAGAPAGVAGCGAEWDPRARGTHDYSPSRPE